MSITITYTSEDLSKADAEISWTKETATTTLGDEFSGPTLNNPHNLDITYSSSDESVATISEGVVSVLAGGVTTITAKFDGTNNETYKSAEVSYELTVIDPNASTVYRKVSSTDDLVAGKKYIFVCEDANTAMGGTITSKNGNSYANNIDVTITNGSTDIAGTDVVELTLEGETGAWAFKSNNGYLNCTGKTKISWSESSVTWNIEEKDDDYVASITVDNTTYYLQYNKEATRFTSYPTTSGQKNAVLYVNTDRFALDDTETTEEDIAKVTAGSAVTIERDIIEGWNAICLPFDVSADDLTAIFGDEAEVGELTNASLEGTTQKLTFTKATSITAGKPCLLWSDNAMSSFTVASVDNVTTTVNEEATGNCTMMGTLVKADNAINVDDIYMAGGTLYFAEQAWPINGFRSWVKVNEAGARNIEIVMDGTTTSVPAAVLGIESDGTTYDLSGRKIASPMKKGIYVRNGKKMVIK